jgi:hypothetical protein
MPMSKPRDKEGKKTPMSPLPYQVFFQIIAFVLCPEVLLL